MISLIPYVLVVHGKRRVGVLVVTVRTCRDSTVYCKRANVNRKKKLKNKSLFHNHARTFTFCTAGRFICADRRLNNFLRIRFYLKLQISTFRVWTKRSAVQLSTNLIRMIKSFFSKLRREESFKMFFFLEKKGNQSLLARVVVRKRHNLILPSRYIKLQPYINITSSAFVEYAVTVRRRQGLRSRVQLNNNYIIIIIIIIIPDDDILIKTYFKTFT